jgi:hypothetical protein
MTAAEYRAACLALGVSPTYGAPKLLGISAVTAARYSCGASPVPKPIARLLETLLKIRNLKEETKIP